MAANETLHEEHRGGGRLPEIDAARRAVDDVARNCGQVAVGCSDAAGYISGVSARVSHQVELLAELETVAGALEADQSKVVASTLEARNLSADARASLQREAALIYGTVAEFSEVTELVTRLGTRMTHFAAAMSQVQDVTQGIDNLARQTNLLALNASIEAHRAGDAGRTFSIVAGEVKGLAQDTRRATEEIARTMEAFTREAQTIISEIGEGVRKSEAAQRGFDKMNETILEIGETVERVDAITEGIDASTGTTSAGIVRLREALNIFDADARENSGQLEAAHNRLCRLEEVSNDMLNQLAHSGLDIADRDLIDLAIASADEVRSLVEAELASGRLAVEDVFDTDYQAIPGSDPTQFMNRFTAFADANLQPILDRVARYAPARVIAVVCSDVNAYLPTHLSQVSQPQRQDDPQWNAVNCRNRRFFMDDETAKAIAFDGDFRLTTYRQNLGFGRYRAVKNVFVPLRINGRRWGNFELGFVD